MNTNWIPTKKVELPISGLIVELNQFLTNGQITEIQRSSLMSEVKISKDEKEMEKNIADAGAKAVVFLDTQEKIFEYIFKSVSKDGENIDVESPIDFFNSVPGPDGMILRQEGNKSMNESMMSQDSKKK